MVPFEGAPVSKIKGPPTHSAALTELSRSTAPWESFAQLLVECACRLLEGERARLWMRDPNANAFVVRASHPPDDADVVPVPASKADAWAGKSGTGAATRGALPFASPKASTSLESPIWQEGELAGVLTVERAKERPWSDADALSLDALAQ